jgi:ribosomal protein L37AE/L43A
MKCDKCGAQMNRHAEKLVFTGGEEEGRGDEVLGGVIEETYGCPACGNVQARRG